MLLQRGPFGRAVIGQQILPDKSAGFGGAQALQAPNSAQFQVPGANGVVTFALWAKPTLLTGSEQDVFSKASGFTFNTYEYALRILATGAWAFAFSGSAAIGQVTSPVLAVAGRWDFLVCAFSADNINSSGALDVYQQGDPLQHTSSTNGQAGIRTTFLTNQFQLGCSWNAAGDTRAQFYNGNIDSFGIWRRGLSGTEQLQLANNKLGLRFNQLPSNLTDVAVWYDLDQPTGSLNWPDKKFANGLSAVGTVTSQPPRGQ